MGNYWIWQTWREVAIGCAIALCGNCAHAQITEDNTLPTNSQIIQQDNIFNIEGGSRSTNNLFHSFREFSVPSGTTAYFKNTADVQNIISRVTGTSISEINGILKAEGVANLFLINPNGIIFGTEAALNIGGSFVASTASSVNFDDGIKFSATEPQTIPLLVVNVPIGLQFGATAATIRNQSQASPGGAVNSFKAPVGLQVQTGKTLALVGGDLIMESGNLTAASGRIELGSVAANSFVSLKSTNQGWVLGYEDVQNFQNIQLIPRNRILAYVDVSGEGSGSIQVQGRQLQIFRRSQLVANTLGSGNKGDVTVNAQESVELIGGSPLQISSFGTGDVGNLTITTKKLIVRDSAQVLTQNQGSGLGGKLTINATDSVEILGGALLARPLPNGQDLLPSGLFTATLGTGNAGDITINTRRLLVQGGARLSAESGTSFDFASGKVIAARGNGGNLTVNASESVEISGTSPNGSQISFLRAATQGPGNAAKVTINTDKFILREGASITVSSEFSPIPYLEGLPNLGTAGELNINARSVLIDNKATITSNSDLGKGGDINFQVQDLFLMRRNSQITTNAGKTMGSGDGGNITINLPNGFIVAAALENNDITANAFSGSGGRVTINANNIFSFVPRNRADLVQLLQTEDPQQLNPQRLPTNDITAFSQENPALSGTVQINTPLLDPSKGLVELPKNLIDPADQIVTACRSSGTVKQGSLVTTGLGGITASPTDLLMGDAVLTDWISLESEDKNMATSIENNRVQPAPKPTEIVEAQGWMVDAHGNLFLVAQGPTVTPQSPNLSPASCPLWAHYTN